ncbi:MAG TPA: hypothetical protein VMU80_18860 [Bryobacteraceae bacterium]|nr:hypothetical protein [Bryobacteraceae bacterium]
MRYAAGVPAARPGTVAEVRGLVKPWRRPRTSRSGETTRMRADGCGYTSLVELPLDHGLRLPDNLWARAAQFAGGIARPRGCAY